MKRTDDAGRFGRRASVALAALLGTGAAALAGTPPCIHPEYIPRPTLTDGPFADAFGEDPNRMNWEVYVPECPLMPGDTLGPAFGDTQLTIASPTWFVYIDDNPMANFEHHVRYVLINALTGSIAPVLEERMFPAVNDTPQYDTAEKRQAGDRVSSGGSVVAGPAAPVNPGAAAPVKAPTVWGVVVGGASDKRHKDGVDKAAKALKKKPGIPDDKIKTKKEATKQEFCDLLKAVKDCDKVYLVITSHGSDTEAGGVKPWRIQFADGWMSTEDLVKKLKATGAKRWCIMAETCFSGCLIDKARGQIDGEIATASSSSSESYAWTWTDAAGNVTNDINHYSEEFWKCWLDETKAADQVANGGDGDGEVEWKEAHKWAKKQIETPGGANGTPGSGNESGQDPQYEETFAFDSFLWSGGQGVSGGQGWTKLDLYNPSATETRQVDWSISLPGPTGLGEADGVGYVNQSGTETLGPKEKKTIRICFTFPVLPNGGIIFPKATIKIHGTEHVIGTPSGCVHVAAPTEPKIDQSGNSSYIPPVNFPMTAQLRFSVNVDPPLVGMPLQFVTYAENVLHDDETVFQVFPPVLELFFNSPSQTQTVILNVLVPPGGYIGQANEIFLVYGGPPATRGIPPTNFATLGVIRAQAVPAGDCNENGRPDADDIGLGFSQDCDGNGRPDECEVDLDCNFNGRPDSCDIADGAPDVNGDGVLDSCQDCDGNGVPDPVQIAQGHLEDCNADGIADRCDPNYDCNSNGISDYCDLATGTASDCNGNNRPDSCDILSGFSMDVNGDGRPDECQDCNHNGFMDPIDIALGNSPDCNADGIPDECQLDANDFDGNGIPDLCDLAAGAEDCDGNGYPDRAQLDELDCNGNGRLDPCDIALGVLHDVDQDGLPDECEQGEGPFTILAGDADNCAVAGEPEDALNIRPTFMTFLSRAAGNNAQFHGGLPLPFDTPAARWTFGYSFENLPEITTASLRLHLKAGSVEQADDGLSLQFFRPPPSFVWSAFISDLEADEGGDGVWNPGDDLTVSLDLGNLPPSALRGGGVNLIPRLNLDRFLDVYVQNGTAVDYVELTYLSRRPTTGACCIDRCTCLELSDAECATQGGIFQGAGAACDASACLPNATCPCDWNGVDGLDSQDFFDFINDFFNGTADFNCADGSDSQDFFDFINCFFDPPPDC